MGKKQEPENFAEIKPRKKKRRLMLIVPVLLVAFAILMPVSNLIITPERPALAEAKMQDAAFAQAGPVLLNSCIDCHSIHTAKPWYFSLPVAQKVISRDVAEGVAALDMTGPLFDDTKDFSQAQLAEIEFAMLSGSMPPTRYVAMHWNASLGKADADTIHNWISDVRTRKYASPNVSARFAGEPIQPIPLSIELNEKKVALGDMLFHDTRLSGDDTLSCASCHGLDKGGTDQDQFATGIDGQLGPINSPTVYNSSYNHLQFWDGRSKDLIEQADGPVNNPLEMGSNWEQVLSKIADDPNYKPVFAELYPDDGMTEKNIRDAIATFEQSLITPNSPFDKYLMGGEDILTVAQLKGYETFVSSGCASCHMGAAVGGLHFEKMGEKADYFADRGTEVLEADQGRFNVTKSVKDLHCFKVPILRNIQVTGPYFHDGTVKTLPEAIKKMGTYQLGLELSAPAVANIDQFLIALTGEYKGTPLTEIKATQ